MNKTTHERVDGQPNDVQASESDARTKYGPAVEIGKRLKELRGDKNQRDFAENELGIAPNTLGKYERGERLPDGLVLLRLAAMGVNLHWLMTGAESGLPATARDVGVSYAIGREAERIHLAYKVIDDWLIANRKGMAPQRKRELVQFMLDHAPDIPPDHPGDLQEPPTKEAAEVSIRQFADKLLKVAA